LVIPEMEKIYVVTLRNKRSIHQYFRKLDLRLKKDKDDNIVVIDTYIRKKYNTPLYPFIPVLSPLSYPITLIIRFYKSSKSKIAA